MGAYDDERYCTYTFCIVRDITRRDLSNRGKTPIPLTFRACR